MKVTGPYLPEITLQDILAFNPDDEQTYTSSRLVNAVAQILCDSNTREIKDFAERLQLDKRHISIVIVMETGMTFKNLIVQYRLTKIKEYMSLHQNETYTHIAELFGFSSPHAFWRFFQTHTGETPEGVKSESPRIDNYHQMVKDVREGRYVSKYKRQ